jgi:hypothetical protein
MAACMRPHSLASIVLIAAALQAPIAAAGDGVSTQPASDGAPASVQPAPDAAPFRADTPADPPADPWGVELAGGPDAASALRRYHELIIKHSAESILAGAEPHLVVKDRIGEMGAVRVRIGAETQAAGEKLCSALMAVGWYCEVFRN